jgi:hypothetical protein
MAPASKMFLKMVLPFLPPAVRAKINLLPNNKNNRIEMLKTLVEEQFIPCWLGGTDDYIFDNNEYYLIGKYKSIIISDEIGKE